MSIHKKIGLATFIALGLAACGSGGSDSPSAAATPNAEMRAAKAELVEANAGQVGKTTSKVDGYTIKLGEATHQVAGMQKGEVVSLQNGNKNIRAYRQAYSIVAGKFDPLPLTEGGKVIDTIQMPMEVALINGEATQKLPTEGKYTYNGAAFGKNETGNLTYHVDFGKRVGSGTVTGLNETGTIQLKEAGIVHTSFTNALDSTQVRAHGIRGETMSEKLGRGDYNLHFFGESAEEVAGTVIQTNGSIGIAGQR